MVEGEAVAPPGPVIPADQEAGCVMQQHHDVPAGAGQCVVLFTTLVGETVAEFVESIFMVRIFPVLRETDSSAAFPSDIAYLKLLELGHVAQQQTYGCRSGAFPEIIVREMTALGITHRAVVKAARTLQDIIMSLVKTKLSKMAKLPMVLRMCKELQLARVEVRAYIFILLCYGGVHFRSNTDLRPTVSNMAHYCEMNSHEFLHFLGDEREHFKQGLIGLNDSHMGRIKRIATNATLTMPEEVVSALYHVKLSEMSYLKIDKTCLSELVQSEGLLLQSDPCNEMSDEESNDESEGGVQSTEPPTKRRRVDPAVDSPPEEEKEKEKEKEKEEDKPFILPEGEEGTLPAWQGDDNKSGWNGGNIATDAGAYQNDLQYLDDVFRLLATQIRVRTTESDMKDDDPEVAVMPKSKQESQLRELKGRERMLKLRIEKRMVKTRASPDPFYPRMEELQKKRGFSNFEKMVLLLLVGNIMSHDILIAANGKYVMRGDTQRETTVGYLLYVLCETLPERVSRRKMFYKSARLLQDGLLTVNTKAYGASELMECTVDIDRRMVDSLMGLDTEFSEIVEGSLLYTSKVPLENVILPKNHKDTILNTISNYDAFQRCKKRVGLEDVVSYGSGLVLLFYGPSGTGKTMLANAIAREMGKKVLVVALTQIKNAGRPELLKYVFREAKLNDAVVFFDECDSFFETREANPLLPALLQELEKYTGIMILATNQAYALDEAMNRRITLAIEFANPDHHMRCEIWRKHIPEALRVSDNVDFGTLATDYELSGGLIKNALLTSISHAVAREEGSEDPLLRMEDFVSGAKTQLRSFFNKDLNQPEQVIPKKSLDDCIFDASTRKNLDDVVAMYRGRKHIQANWGFGQGEMSELSCMIVLYGPTGVGKSLAAEAIGYECGHSLRVINLRSIKAASLEKIFTEVTKAGAILVIDEAQFLLSRSDETEEMVSLFTYHARKCTRPVILIARTDSDRVVDVTYTDLKVSTCIRFSTPPAEVREQLWQKAFPKDTPIADDVKLSEFAQKQMSPGSIKNAVFIASCKASMEPAHCRKVTKELLQNAADEVIRLTTSHRVDIYS